MYVVYDLHYNVLWGRYASELKGLTKKLLKSISAFVAMLYNQLRHCNVCITQYGSTVYIGMAMGCSAL